LLRRKIDHEIRLDVRVLEGLADQSADIEGMKLSRFDKVLALNRERINRIYRGLGPNGRETEYRISEARPLRQGLLLPKPCFMEC
jgi:hypothetical protein